MWELDHKKGWAPKNGCFWTVVLKKTLENPLDSKIKLVNPKGNQPRVFTGRTDAKAPILWPPDVMSQLTGKDPAAGKDWRQEKWVAEDDIVRWHYWLSGRKFEQTQGESEGQRSLGRCSPWGHRVRHNLVTKQQVRTTIVTKTQYKSGFLKSCFCHLISVTLGKSMNIWVFSIKENNNLCPNLLHGII